MNQVSDLRLALAAYDAGIVPSLVLNDPKLGLKQLEQDLLGFSIHTGNCNLILALTPKSLTPELVKLILKYKVSYLELFENIEEKHLPVIKILRKNNVKIIEKYLTAKSKPVDDVTESLIDVTAHIDAIHLKGPEGASRVIDTGETLMQRFEIIRKKYPNMGIIVAGGISTSAEIKKFIDAGAMAVSMGTVFALSTESPINHKKKEALINSTFNNIEKVKAGNMYQNAVVFTATLDTDENNTVGLILGRDSADEGLIFVGKGIDNIKSIKSVSTIVKELTKEL